jgi:hypothetical protein
VFFFLSIHILFPKKKLNRKKNSIVTIYTYLLKTKTKISKFSLSYKKMKLFKYAHLNKKKEKPKTFITEYDMSSMTGAF